MNISRFESELGKVLQSPNRVMNLVFDTLNDRDSGSYPVVSSSNPFVQLMEMAVSVGSETANAIEATTRGLYPALAETRAELYRHMTASDHLGVHAQPNHAQMNIVIAISDLRKYAVPYGTVQRVTIPGDTQITTSLGVFCICNTINITVHSNGSVVAHWDTDLANPVLPITDATVEHSILDLEGDGALHMVVPVLQMTTTTVKKTVPTTNTFKHVFPLTDQFFYCRAWHLVRGNWVELETSYSAWTVDDSVPRVNIEVLDQSVEVTVPVVYLLSGSIGSSIRIDLYETLGDLKGVSLSSIDTDDYVVEWLDHNSGRRSNYNLTVSETDEGTSLDDAHTRYTAPLALINDYVLRSDSKLDTGRDALGFEELKSIVLNSAVDQHSPNSPLDLRLMGERLGYSLHLASDTITNRIYYASKALPNVDGAILSSAHEYLVLVLSEIIARNEAGRTLNPANIKGYISHRNGGTLTPECLFERVNGVVELLSETEHTQMRDILSSMEAHGVNISNPAHRNLIRDLNTRDFLVSPLHYVLNAMDDQFTLVPYSMQQPTVTTLKAISNGQSTLGGLGIAVQNYSIHYTEAGYLLKVETEISQIPEQYLQGGDSDEVETAKVLGAVSMFLSQKDPGSSRYSHVRGQASIVENKITFSFALVSDWDMLGGRFSITNLKYQLTDTVPVTVPLHGTFELLSFVNLNQASASTVVDNTITELAPLEYFGTQDSPTGLSRSEIKLNFGQELSNLRAGSYSTPIELNLRTHDVDVVQVHTEDVYETTSDGKLVFYATHPTLDTERCAYVTGGVALAGDTSERILPYGDWTIVTNLVHRINTPVLDSTGAQVVQHAAGSPMLDAQGEPVYETAHVGEERRHVELLLVDATYRFTTDLTALEHSKYITKLLSQYCNESIETLEKRLAPGTELELSVSQSSGEVTGQVDGESTITMSAELTYDIVFYVDESVKDDIQLQNSIRTTVGELVHEHSRLPSLSDAILTKNIVNAVGDDIVTVMVNGISSSERGQTAVKGVFTHSDPEALCSIKRLVEINTERQLVLADAIHMTFVYHG